MMSYLLVFSNSKMSTGLINITDCCSTLLIAGFFGLFFVWLGFFEGVGVNNYNLCSVIL